MSESIRRFYDGWDHYNEQIVSVVQEMTEKQLGIRPTPDRWPLWATIGHTAGVRVYRLCGVLGEPGAETTPFKAPLSAVGWEDDLGRPRSSVELVEGLEATWKVVEGCLDRWNVDMLGEKFTPPSGTRPHTRQSVLMRLLTHDAYHCGELSQTLGIHDLTQIDLWAPRPGKAGETARDQPG